MIELPGQFTKQNSLRQEGSFSPPERGNFGQEMVKKRSMLSNGLRRKAFLPFQK